MSAPLTHPVVVKTEYLPAKTWAYGIELAADLALSDGQSVAFLGATADGMLVLCRHAAEHAETPGALIAVPDTVVAEMAANGVDTSAGLQFTRAGGRTVTVWRSRGAR